MTMSLYCSSLLILCIATSAIAQNTLNAVNCCSRIEKSVASFSSQISSTCNGPSDAAIASLEANVSALQETVSSLQEAVSSLSADIKKVLNYSSDPFFTSCYDILQKFPDSPSGYYRIVGFSHKVYCHMSNLPNTDEKGWIRIAYLDMWNTKDCPSGFKFFDFNGVRACGRPYSPCNSCTNTYFQVQDFKYSQIHGKLVGFQVGTTDGAHGTAFNINSGYVDGVMLTHGRTRKHIWTFIAGQDNDGNRNYCPCAKWYAHPKAVPSFVGNDYYCEGGSHHSPAIPHYFYRNDPLWDGLRCGTSEEACCKPPWFSKTINPPTSDSIELRLCLDEGSDNEDVLLKGYQIYIR
ncbi:PREDICTED: uncharacterized protein LOC109587462 [Amphimedon queenslandica]|uniref:Fibrinogen C-terminal domain-containing protein n=1 Tax=Amphimedon queenslandica TaxID=400682 RepID=A0A1X7TJ61_AMPQE|nr:PREDICTED: uncharacterized protein LOC109587462 [Amphimedon queenslandica]|eukprot:XP_019859268.1 PREDICTED: uncharacterized protein LOC109587462 [Amphimedon queenslandica]